MLYLHKDYRTFLEAAIQRKKNQGKFTLRELSSAAQIQPTYLTNVLMGRAHLNQDQLYAITEALSLNIAEREYVSLLLENERSIHPKRKKELLSQIEKIQNESLRPKKHLKATSVTDDDLEEREYYLDCNILLVHVFLRVPKYARDLKQIAEDLNFSQEKLSQILALLERQGFIQWDEKSKQYNVLKHSRLLDADSPVCLPNQLMMRLKSLQRIQEIPIIDRSTVSITYFANKAVRKEIQSEFVSFLKKAEKLAKDSKHDDEVFQLNFDLFAWS